METKSSLLLTFAIIAILIAFINLSVSFTRLVSIKNILTGLAIVTDTAVVNLTVTSEAQLNFSVESIEWGVGLLHVGFTNASLSSSYGNLRGNWTNLTTGLRLDNIGNVNVSLNLSAGKTPASFLGGTENGYFWNVTNVDAGSCFNATATSLNTYLATTTTETRICRNFSFISNANSVRIDILLFVPQDAPKGIVLTDTITAEGDTVGVV